VALRAVALGLTRQPHSPPEDSALNAPQLNQVAAAAQASTSTDFDRLLQQRAFTPQDLMQGENLDRLERIAERMASGRMTVPEYLRGNTGDCMAIAIQAMLWNMDPFAVAQKTHIVSGRLGFEAQLVNAVLQNSGAIRGLPHYEYRGEGNTLECRVGCVPRGEADIRWGEWLSIGMVTTKNSPLWKVNPRQQMGYLQVKNWARAFAPGAILGVYTIDELEDFAPPARGAAPAPAAVPASPTLPIYPDADFEKNLPLWRNLVESGRKTATDLLATLSTKAKFTEAQQAQIKQLGAPAPAAAAPAEPLSGEHADFVAAMDDAEGGAE
jgi:hypothetical protein